MDTISFRTVRICYIFIEPCRGSTNRDHVISTMYCKVGCSTSCENISTNVGFTKTRAFLYKPCQNISNSVGMTKSGAVVYKSCQNISSSVGMTKSGVVSTNLVKTALIYSVVTIYLGLRPRMKQYNWYL